MFPQKYLVWQLTIHKIFGMGKGVLKISITTVYGVYGVHFKFCDGHFQDRDHLVLCSNR